MKRLFMVCVLCLCLGACQSARPDIDAETAAARITSTCESDRFVRADADFISTNFGSPDYLKEATVYYAANGDGTEFGFFLVANAAKVPDMERLVKDYLATERAAVESLAALYPAEELSDRLARFDRATVGHAGDTVYYCMAEPALCQRFLKEIK